MHNSPNRRYSPECSLKGCGRRHYSKGYCRTHHARFERNGDPGPAHIGDRPSWMKLRGQCRLKKCGKAHYALGLCQTHYNCKRFVEENPDNHCGVRGCKLRHVAKGMCFFHYFATKCNEIKTRANALSFD